MEATAKNYEIIHAVTRYPLLYTLKLGCGNITPCNNQLPRCDIAWLHVTNNLYYGFPS